MTDTKLETLIEDYQRRIRSATTIIEDPATSQSQRERVLVKLGEYKAFLRDLESLEASVPTPKGNGMTDTVNKQAQDIAESYDIELRSLVGRLLERGNYGAADSVEKLADRMKQEVSKELSTPVQGYREAQRYREALETIRAEFDAWNNPGAAINVVRAFIDQALSQTDIQPSGVQKIREYIQALDEIEHEQADDIDHSFVLGERAGIKFALECLGINSTEDDQPGPSISSTQLMLEGEEQ